MSISPSDSPNSRWSLGSKSNVGTSPTVSRVTKSSSPPAGAPSWTILEIARCAASSAACASCCSASACLTLAASSLDPSSSAGRSSGTPGPPSYRRPSARRAECHRRVPRRDGTHRPRAARRPAQDLHRGCAATRGRRRGSRGGTSGQSRCQTLPGASGALIRVSVPAGSGDLPGRTCARRPPRWGARLWGRHRPRRGCTPPRPHP